VYQTLVTPCTFNITVIIWTDVLLRFVGANKAISQQAVTLNHSSRLLNSVPASRRMSVTSLGNSAAETNTSATGSNLGLSMPGLSALLAGN
jgi:hypothetical protein